MPNARLPKIRTIFNNYNPYETYPDDTIKELLLDNDYVTSEDKITDAMICQERDFLLETDWEQAKNDLTTFFNNRNKFILVGDIGRWNGIYQGGFIFETFNEMFNKATKDCDYIHFYDINGHLHLTCSHHDGRNHFEIKEITDKGIEYLENWEDNMSDPRTARHIHTQIFNKYSHIPHFAHIMYGCKQREYEPITKPNLYDRLNNQAMSFYN